jgi:glycosyltransferase involved in cell wall biosynthesis
MTDCIKLSLIISQRNDPVGTLITIRSALEAFKVLGHPAEIIVVDNSDDDIQRMAIKDLIPAEYIREGTIKLLFQPFPSLFSARELGVSKSTGEYLLFVDSHCVFGRDSVKHLLDFSLTHKGIGLAYGLCCYSHRIEDEAWCDRNVSTSKGIRIGWYSDHKDPFPVPFRGMPFLCHRDTFSAIGGYGFLSRYKLTWGGGDYFLGLKSSILGFTNWSIPSSIVIHLGPFKDDRYLTNSFFNESPRTYPVRVGMLAASYAIGGIGLANSRLSHIHKLVNHRTLESAMIIGEEDRRWIESKAVMSYDQLVNKFSALHQYEITPVSS